jgi:hypothetical protein
MVLSQQNPLYNCHKWRKMSSLKKMKEKKVK